MRGGPSVHAAAEVDSLRSQRAFWVFAILIDLLLLLFLGKIGVFALAIALALTGAGFAWRVEWLLAFLLLGAPSLAFLPLEEDGFTRLLLVFRGLYIVAWWFAIGRPFVARESRPHASAAVLGRVPAALGSVRRAFSHPIAISAVLLAVWMWIGLSWTEAERYGESKTIAMFFGNLFLMFAPLLLWPVWREPRALDRFLRGSLVLGVIFAGFGVAAALGLAEQLSFGALVRVQILTKERLAWLGVSQIWSARMLAVWIVLVLWSARRRVVRPALAAILVAVALLLIARTGSRGPLAALLVCPAALWFVPRRREPEAVPDPGGEESVRSFARFARRAVPAVIGVMVIAVLALPKDDREAVVAGLMRGPIGVALEAGGLGDLTSSISVSVAQDPSTVYRRHLAQRSLATLSEALPWGAGTGSFPALLFMRDARLYPHNILAELLIENGWPGLALFVLFVLLVWRSAWRLSRRSHAGRWLFVLFAMALSNAQVSGDTGTNEWIWLWAGMIAGLEMATRRCAESLTVRTVPRVAFK